MNQNISYRPTIIACYIGYFTQAIIVNLTPVLFVPLREQFGFSFSRLGFLVLCNFITQMLVDLLFSVAADRYGYRIFIVASHVLTAVGLTLFAATPYIMSFFNSASPPSTYYLIVIATVIFSIGGGLLELLVSPIVNAIPSKEKSAAMSLLHSFYCWGQVAVVLGTTLFLYLFGKERWPVIMLIWTLIPILNTFLFIKVPLAPGVSEEQRHPAKDMIRNPFLIAFFLSIFFSGASEISISQWSSTFMEAALGIPKVVGDTAGMCMFGVMMGLGRMYYGVSGGKKRGLSLDNLMLAGAVLSFCCYLIVVFSNVSIISLLACALCGLGVSLMWPGTLSLAAGRFPMAGAWMFAILAAGGDTGASVGPWFVGFVADHAIKLAPVLALAESLAMNPEQLGLRIGMLCASVFPLGLIMVIVWLKKKTDGTHKS